MDPENHDYDEWDAEIPDRIGRASYETIYKATLHLFANTDILDERPFDEAFAEHKLPDVYRQTAEQTVPVTSTFPEYDDPDSKDFYVNCTIGDPIDAAILLNARETDVILQALDALIAFVEDRLGQFKNDIADDPLLPDAVEGGEKKVKRTQDDQVEGDEYFKNTLIRCPGFLNRVVQLTGSVHRSIRRRAVILLGSLSEVEEAVVQFEFIPWLKKLHHLIKPGTEPVVLDWLILALKNFSILHNVQEEVYRESLLEQFLDLATMDNQDPDVTENLIQALVNLSANKHVREYLALNGGFEVATEQALSEFPSTQYYALRLMRDLIHCPAEGVVDRFHEADGVATVVSILNTEELKFVHAITLEVLEFLLGVPSVAHELSQKRIYEFVLDRALSKEYQGVEDFRATALRAITRAAYFPDQRLIMNNCDIERRIIQLLTLPSFVIQAAALQAIGNLAKTMNCRRKFREFHAVKVIAKHLSSCDLNVREQAFFAAGSLMLCETGFVETFLTENFVQLLYATLTDLRVLQATGLLDQALACVINISELDHIKDALAPFVVKHIPIWLSQQDEAIKIKALICAGIFVRNEHDVHTFSKYNGYSALGNTLKPPASDNLIRHVCWAIALLATQRSTIVGVCRSGCVSPLMETRNALNPVTSGYADLALRRLVSLHLSFKYALFDEIGPDDRIQHGFYDMGRHFGRSGFLSLKAHLRARTGTAQPVIFVSVPRKKFVTAPFVDKSAKSAVTDIDGPRIKDATPSKTKIISPEGADKDTKPEKAGKVRKPSKGHIKPKTPPTVEEPLPLPHENPAEPILPPSNSFSIPADPVLQKLIKTLLANLLTVRNIREEITLISQTVASHMGGPDITPEIAEKQLKELCETKSSHCIALGNIGKGSFTHRALLFKVIADRIHLPVSLVRGKQGRAWNEIHLAEDGGTRIFVIDLMQEPGKLLLINTDEAAEYTECPPVLQTLSQFKKMADVESSTIWSQNSASIATTLGKKMSKKGSKNQLAVRGSAISIRKSLVDAVSSAEEERLRRFTSVDSIVNPSTSLLRKIIVQDMEGPPEPANHKHTTAGLTNALGNEPKEKAGSLGNAEVKNKDMRLEPRAPASKWRPKSTHDHDATYVAAIPRELPPLTQVIPTASHISDKHVVTQPVLSKTPSWHPLRSRTSLETSDIWDGAPAVATNDIRKSVVPGVQDILAEADSEDIPDGYDVVLDRWDEMTYDEQMLLERWEMDLEDDVVNEHGDSNEEAEDVILPAEQDKIRPLP